MGPAAGAPPPIREWLLPLPPTLGRLLRRSYSGRRSPEGLLKFSKVSSLLISLCKISAELTCE